ncbi:hypothetical protein BS50DRAFT_270352 [Corynespora cassiicola Philippines]|uniref:Uncharacterized protein n=1 Tax=Corynespora cassiicola Philippines TaxID=1448308 RepID=A0A2T2P0B5_CORCC|nr:hypothetical protein BS50DRAFT_270352 [Corynespora cassiicola Philippines]
MDLRKFRTRTQGDGLGKAYMLRRNRPSPSLVVPSALGALHRPPFRPPSTQVNHSYAPTSHHHPSTASARQMESRETQRCHSASHILRPITIHKRMCTNPRKPLPTMSIIPQTRPHKTEERAKEQMDRPLMITR